MSTSARLFIAVKIAPPRPLRKVVSQLGLLGRAVRALDPDQLHLTLKFLGDCDISLTPQIAAAVEAAVQIEAAFALELKGLGVFPHARRPTVVWAGVENPESLVAMASRLDALLLPVGFAVERRPYHPHITLARINSKPPDELAVMLEAEQWTEFGGVEVESIELYQSELTPSGPRYTVLSRAELSSG